MGYLFQYGNEKIIILYHPDNKYTDDLLECGNNDIVIMLVCVWCIITHTCGFSCTFILTDVYNEIKWNSISQWKYITKNTIVQRKIQIYTI